MNAGIVDYRGKFAMCPRYTVYRRNDGGLVGDVENVPVRGDRRRCLACRFGVSIRDDHSEAVRLEAGRNGKSDAAGAAGYEGGPVAHAALQARKRSRILIVSDITSSCSVSK